MTLFPRLFSPIRVGNVTLPNRVVSTGHATGFAVQGYPGERELLYQLDKAKGGVGLTIFGGTTSVHKQSPANGLGLIANRDDSIIPHYRRMADAVHSHGARVMTQLSHYGRHSHSDTEEWLPLVGPSQVPGSFRREIPHELEDHQIREIIVAFGQAVRRCKDGGLDGVELSASHNHLIDQFWSPNSNRRTDGWGGSLENRMRFSLEVLEEIRGVVGREYAVGIRMSGDEFLENGIGPSTLRTIAERLSASGMIDFIGVTGGSAENNITLAMMTPDMTSPMATHIRLAAAMKACVNQPVLYAARVTSPELAENILADGLSDLVGMTRALIADPDLAQKAKEGREDDIRPCVGANLCIDRLYGGRDVVCIHNPVIGREQELSHWNLAPQKKKVVVVGGGPAGLEAARMASLRGHRVVLFERSTTLGGQVTLASRVPGHEALAQIVGWLETQARKGNVELRCSAEATAVEVLEERPDHVVIATGGYPYRPEGPGFDSPHVFTSWEVLAGDPSVGDRVLIVEDGGPERAATLVAEYLIGRGRRVEIVTSKRWVGEGLGETTFSVAYQRLLNGGVIMTPNVRVRTISDCCVELENVYTSRQEKRDPIDTVILAMGNRSEDAVYRDLKGKFDNLHLIGDAMAPRSIHTAILEGTRVGRVV